LASATIHWHGHNYVLEVSLSERLTRHGMIANLADLDASCERQVLEDFDHNRSMIDVPAFRDTVPHNRKFVHRDFSDRLKFSCTAEAFDASAWRKRNNGLKNLDAKFRCGHGIAKRRNISLSRLVIENPRHLAFNEGIQIGEMAIMPVLGQPLPTADSQT